MSYKAERDGRPVTLRRMFSSEDAAWAFAAERDVEIGNHGRRYGDVPPELRRAYDSFRDAKAELEAAGATVPPIEQLIADAIAGIRAAHAAREETLVMVADAVEEFVSYKKSRVGTRQLIDLRIRLKRFAESFGDRAVATITTSEINQWLETLRSRRNPGKLPVAPLIGPLARNHYRAALSSFFAYGAAPARQWCDRNPIADLEKERVVTGEPEAYSFEDAARIMQASLEHHLDLVPVLALGMFAGLRVSEAVEIDLGRLSADTDEFRATGKTGPRMAPFTAACRAWVAAQPRRTGKAWLKSPRQLAADMKALFKTAGVEPINNGARHSFISFRTAETRDVARTADECGNSVGTIKAHYRQLVTGEAAERFFAIRPQADAENVTDIQDGRASA